MTDERDIFGVVEYTPDNNTDTAYTKEDMNIMVIKTLPSPQQYPECYDWKCKLKDGISKELGEPIYSDEYEYIIPILKSNWREVLGKRET